uniref:Uncharacterized protein n=1 Tax=Panagrolaimus davidi TaxID=227884 RepID=A0A914QT33_9BILA
MRIWIYGIISLLMVTYVIGDPAADVLGYDNSGSNIFALTPDCKLVISKLSKFESSVNEANRGTKSHDCDNGELLHFYSGTDTSNLMVFVPTQVDPKKETKIYKGMKVYGTKLIDESAGNVTDLNQEFEIIDYNYVLPPKCGFDPKNFKVGLDVNVIFMLVTYENHLAFLRTQINFQKSMVFTPKTWMVHFEPSVQTCICSI